MKLIRHIVAGLALVLLFFGTAWSIDFAKMSNQELADLRGAIQNAPQADREVFQKEWDKRLATMSDEEKKRYTQPEKSSEDADKLKKPTIPARGYDTQQGMVIFGGGPVAAPGPDAVGK